MKKITNQDEAQLITFPEESLWEKTARLRVGLLINFSDFKLDPQRVERKTWR